MKTLYLLRHAKSDWAGPVRADFDRPLNRRGRAAAKRMGRLMARRGLVPALVLCSAAARTRETWMLAAPAFEENLKVRTLRTLYLASPETLLTTLTRLPESTPSVLILGHNPGLEELASQLAGPGSKKAALKRLRNKFPSGALAVFEIDTNRWAKVGEAPPRLAGFFRPRDAD